MTKKILIITPYYLPSYNAGGPIRSISNLVHRYKNNHDFSIVTPNHDLDGSVYESTIPNEWNQVNGTKVFYISDYLKFINMLRKTSTLIDIIYINSMFSFKYSILIVLLKNLGLVGNTKIIIAPRGEFALSALSIKSPKKSLYIQLSKVLNIYNKVTWHATAEKEYKEIKEVFPNASIEIADNLSSSEIINDFKETKIKKLTNELYIVSLARIVPIKNLIFSLELLNGINNDNTIYFDIYGPIEDEPYWEKCQNIISKLPENIIVKYKGSVENDEVLNTLKKYHLYILPTKGENFGHSIAEALKASCPVLISDQTPWRDLTTKNIGWDVSLFQRNEYIKIINDLSILSNDDIINISSDVNKFMRLYILDTKVDNKYKKLFK